jgi:hypothetical protein
MCVLQVVDGGAHTEKLVQAVSCNVKILQTETSALTPLMNKTANGVLRPSTQTYQGVLHIQNVIFTEQE